MKILEKRYSTCNNFQNSQHIFYLKKYSVSKTHFIFKCAGFGVAAHTLFRYLLFCSRIYSDSTERGTNTILLSNSITHMLQIYTHIDRFVDKIPVEYLSTTCPSWSSKAMKSCFSLKRPLQKRRPLVSKVAKLANKDKQKPMSIKISLLNLPHALLYVFIYLFIPALCSCILNLIHWCLSVLCIDFIVALLFLPVFIIVKQCCVLFTPLSFLLS